ncbi:MAG: class I SAM-dependent methyltransferase [Pseudomonadota bacterium]
MAELNQDAKTERSEAWDQAAAAWASWWPMIQTGAQPVSQRMLELAELAPGQRVLDLASGIGEPAASAARVVGPEGSVVATDLSDSMITHGRARMAKLGLDNVEFRKMDAEAPDLAPGQFDAVLIRWGLMFVHDLAGCLRGLRDLLKPGGRLSLAVWATPDQAPALSLAQRVLDQELSFPPPKPDERTAFQLSDRPALEASLAAAGFESIVGDSVSVVYEFESPARFIAFRQEVSAINQKLAAYRPERVAAAWQAVERAAEAYRTDEGTLRFENISVCLAARKPV